MADVPPAWSISEARDLARAEGAGHVVDSILERFHSRSRPGVWISVADEDALRARADELDATAAAGRALPLHGVPFAVKDNIDVAGVPTTAGAREFAYEPADDARAVRGLLDAGAIFVGKTNLDQFATGLCGTRSPQFGICGNPYDPDYIVGGSSSGSAVAVATGLVPLALGTDTAGSGRVPAACCGVLGFKPTRERVSTHGLVPASPSFDTVSVFATSGADAGAAFTAIAELDGMRSDQRVPARWRVGVPGTLAWFGDDDARRCYEAAIAKVEALGAELYEIDLSPFLEAGALLYGSALVAERYASFGEFVLKHPGATDPAVRTLVLDAPHHAAPSVFRALRQLARLHTSTAGIWKRVDGFVVPTIARHPTIAEAQQQSIATSRDLGTYTNFVNLLDLAAVAVPAGMRASGLPFGVTMIGPAFSDRALLSLASAFLGEPTQPTDDSARYRVAVVGAHLTGQPLNRQLVDLGGELLEGTTTSPAYRLYDLGKQPAKPGMVRDPDRGAAIEVEVWSLDAEGFGSFVAGIPSPLGIGSVELADGSRAPGFLCEPFALRTAREITAFGGWRAYLATT